jgi:hypothetical protein
MRQESTGIRSVVWAPQWGQVIVESKMGFMGGAVR